MKRRTFTSTATETATSICDRCLKEFPSSGMVYWLVEIRTRPTLSPMADVAIGSPKFCKGCAEELKFQLKELFNNEIRILA